MKTEQKRKEDKTSPTAETVRNIIITHFIDFSPYEFGRYISSLLEATVMPSPLYQKLRRPPLDFAVDETDLNIIQEWIFIFKRKAKKCYLHNRKKEKVFRYATLLGIQKGEHPLTLAFLPVLLGQKRKDTVATLLKFVQGMHLKPRLILMDGGFA